jgi:hypothetical protein
MIVNRVGSFFMIVGGFLVLLFMFSLQAGEGGRASYLLWGLGLFVLGVILWWRGPKPPPHPSNRFRLFKREKKAGRSKRGNERDRLRGENRQPPVD